MGIKEREKTKSGRENERSHAGACSCYLAGGALLILAAAIAIAFWLAGSGQRYVGGMGLTALLLSAAGIRFAMDGFRFEKKNPKLRAAFSEKKDRNHTFCKVGLTANLLLFFLMLVIFVIGCL